MKILVRTLIILLAAVLVSTATYYIAKNQQVNLNATGQGRGPSHRNHELEAETEETHTETELDASGTPGIKQVEPGGEEDEEDRSAHLLNFGEFGRSLLFVSVITLIVAPFSWAVNRWQVRHKIKLSKQ